MSFATDKWFKYLHEEILIEGLGDIGLDETIKEEIRSALPEASEKGRVWVGNAWKSIDGGTFIGYGWFIRHIKEEIAPLGKNFRRDEGNDIEHDILWNLIQNYEGQSPGKWPKLKRKFANTAKKKGFSEEDIRDLLYQFEQLDLKCWNLFAIRIQNIFTTLNQNPNNYEMIKEIPPSDWMIAEDVCHEFQMNQEKPAQIMHTFDDGSYWYNLETYRCGNEGVRMGHCGTDERGTLYSLRKKDKGKKNSTSYITISYNENTETIYQIKGRANNCPPEKLWSHIATFIDITGAQTLEESGQYSSEPEKFEQLGQWLSENTGINFEGSLEKRVEEMTEACREFERGFREDYGPHTYFRQVVVDTDDMWDGAQIRPRWYQDDIDFITVQVNFDLEDKYLLRQSEDLGDELRDELYDIIDDNDSNGVISEYGNRPDFSFIRAYSLEEATRKYHTHGYRSDKRSFYLEGDKTFLVVSDIDSGIESATDDLNRYEADNYHLFLNVIRDFINEVEESIDKIKLLLIEQEYIAKPGIISYKEKADETFNNFIVSTIAGRNQFQFILTSFGILFYTTPEEMQAIMQTDLLDVENFYKTKDNYYSSLEFKNKIIEGLQEKENEAIDFAKRQMKLNFGEKYEQKIDSIWEKFRSVGMYKIATIKNDMFAAFAVRQRNPDTRSTEKDYFSYKLSFDFNESTYPIFAPIVEYYDNNIDFVVSVFDRVVKEYIKEAAVRHREKTQKADVLPMQEGLIIEGLGDIGLSKQIVDLILDWMPDASEKGRVWIGNALKEFAPLDAWGTNRRFEEKVKEFLETNGDKYVVGEYNLFSDFMENLDTRMKRWNKYKKSFIKSCKKQGIANEDIEKAVDFYDQLEFSMFTTFSSYTSEIMITLNQDPANYEKAILFNRVETDDKGNKKYFYDSISDFPPSEFRTVEQLARDYQDKLDVEEQKVIKFDDGAFWYDLRSSYCTVEAERMGHCGQDDRATLYSLRKKEGNQTIESKSHVTIAFDKFEVIYQIKGRFNNTPEEKFWPYIAKFITEMGVQEIRETGQYMNEEQKPKLYDMLKFLNEETGAKIHIHHFFLEKLKQLSDQWGEENPKLSKYVDLDYRVHEEHNPNGDYTIPKWTQNIDRFLLPTPFETNTKYRTIQDGIEENRIMDSVLEIISSKDRNAIIGDAAGEMEIHFEMLSNHGQVYPIMKFQGFERQLNTMIIHNMNLDRADPSSFKVFLDKVKEFMEDVISSMPEIREFMKQSGYIKENPFYHIAIQLRENIKNLSVFVSKKRITVKVDTLSPQIDNIVIGRLPRSEDRETLKTNFRKLGSAGREEVQTILFEELKKFPSFPEELDNEQFKEEFIEAIDFFRYGEGVLIDVDIQITEDDYTYTTPLAIFIDQNYPEVKETLKNILLSKLFGEPLQEARENPLDVRLYEIDFVMSYPLGKGFEMTDIHNIIRAIPDVTTVRTIGDTKRTQANRVISLQRLKFALQGRMPRNEWVKQVLIPQIHKISSSIRLHKVERADLVSSSKQRLEEVYAAFSQRPSAPRTTPRPTIQGLIDDWVEGGVMYDAPTNMNLTRYSVMMPVADLEHLMGREARKHGHHFESGYENFIKNGVRDPIYLAIGKNGRAKITGNEDDLRYAIKAGVEEVPVFISYQRQV